MVKRKVIWSQRANRKVFGILDFYAQRNKSTAYSTKLYKRFINELSLLDKHPELGIKTEFESIRGLIVEDLFFFTRLHLKIFLFIQYGIAGRIPMTSK